MEVLCKWHVIVKYILNHDSKEKYFPIMTCAFWLSIVSQSLLYITYIEPNSVSLSSELPKILIVAFFFSTIVLLYSAVKNDLRYHRAEAWFNSLSISTSRQVKVVVGTSMLLSFFVFMIWAITLM